MFHHRDVYYNNNLKQQPTMHVIILFVVSAISVCEGALLRNTKPILQGDEGIIGGTNAGASEFPFFVAYAPPISFGNNKVVPW